MRLIRDVAYGEHEKNQMDLYIPDQPAFRTLVWFHGGCLTKGSRVIGPMGEYCAAHGVLVASADYRLYPEARYPDFIVDAAQAVHFAKEKAGAYGKSEGLYLGGSSAGAYLSMMLAFDRRWLARFGLSNADISGYIHNAGQPTTHYNVLAERGMGEARIVVDEAAPLYHVGEEEVSALPPMSFILAERDMPTRREQINLLLSTMRRCGFPEEKLEALTMKGTTHCSYNKALDENGRSVLGKIVCDFIGRN